MSNTTSNEPVVENKTEETSENSTTVNEEPNSVNENDSNNETNNESEKTDWKAEAEKWKELSRKNETASKENYKNFSELNEKFSALKEQLDAASKFKDENVDLLRRLVVAETGLPAELSARLNGSNEEELKKDAESLKQIFGEVKKTPKPIQSQGTDQGSGFDSGTIRTAEDYEKSYRNQR